jgi:hypothetical protein
MGCFLIESVVIALFVSVIWKFILYSLIPIEITYVQWLAMIWIVKVVFFDVFKLLAGLSNIPEPKNENVESHD